jgi:hypothetical protein
MSLEKIELVSFGYPVVTIKVQNGKIHVKSWGILDGSMRRHLKWFLEEHLPDVSTYDIQRIAGLGYVPLTALQNMHTEHTAWR